MKFSVFKLGKTKEKKEKADTKDTSTTQIAGLEEELNNRTNNLLEKQKQLDKLSGNGKKAEETEVISARPHGPIEELKLEPGGKPKEADVTLKAGVSTLTEETGGEIKMVEMKAEAAPPPKEEKKDESLGDSLNQIFRSDEEEENPLEALIKSLPDVTANELMKDLSEIKDIIKEWQKK